MVDSVKKILAGVVLVFLTTLLIFVGCPQSNEYRPLSKVEKAVALLTLSIGNLGTFAFYYPWYGMPNSSGQWYHWNDSDHNPDNITDGMRDIAATDYPVLDVYDSNNETVIRQHITWAKEAGIDCFVISWWGINDFTDNASKQIVNACQQENFNFTFYIENTTSIDHAVQDINYLLSTFGNSSSWYRVNDLPVIFVYQRARDNLNPQAWVWHACTDSIGVDPNQTDIKNASVQWLPAEEVREMPRLGVIPFQPFKTTPGYIETSNPISLLKKMGGLEYWNTKFTYIALDTSEEKEVKVPEKMSVGPIFLPPTPTVGEVIGLAVTQSFGALQRFEVVATEGTGRLIPLGSMMRVMKESLKAAYEHMSYNNKTLGIDPDFKKDYDITVLATQMGMPKEGPSAGITILTAMISALVKKPVRNDVAMTGEITLFGKILQVGGVQEKLIAAAEAGIRKVYVPAGNERDIEMLPSEIKSKLEIKLVSKVEEVLNDAIIGYQTMGKSTISSPEIEEISISPEKPFTSLTRIYELIGTLKGVVQLLDKDFGEEAFKFLLKLDNTKVSHLLILGGKSHLGSSLKEAFTAFREEMKRRGIAVECRILDEVDSKDIHDRYLIAQGVAYSTPPWNIINKKLGDIRRIEDHWPKKVYFEKYWKRGTDIFNIPVEHVPKGTQ